MAWNPTFLYDNCIDECSKSILFNRYVYTKYKEENPDVILLSVPNPIMKYNDDILNGLGIIPYIMLNSVKSDVGILSLYFAKYTHKYLKQLMNLCEYRFGVTVNHFGVSNTRAAKSVDDTKDLNYLLLDASFVKNNIPYEAAENEFTLFSIFDENDSNDVFSKIENELIDNPLAI